MTGRLGIDWGGDVLPSEGSTRMGKGYGRGSGKAFQSEVFIWEGKQVNAKTKPYNPPLVVGCVLVVYW